MDHTACKQQMLTLFCLILATAAQIVCNETYVLSRGVTGHISCKFVSTFISVRWYKEPSEVPIAIIERGKKVIIDGYDITDTGDLVISNVNLYHEGNYRVSLLDDSGTSNTRIVAVIIKVPLTNGPTIQRCATSKLELCQKFDERNKENAIVCQTMDTRPMVDLLWETFPSSRFPKSYSESYMNKSSGLFTTSSILEYNPEYFSLQFITCNASGLAVDDVWESSIFVDGSQVVEVEESRNLLIKQGSRMKLDCTLDYISLRKWTYINPKGIKEVIKLLHPNGENGPCLANTKCHIEHGSLIITEIKFTDEGIYECLYSNENRSGRIVITVDVIIPPQPPEVVIEGCRHRTGCEKDVGHTGELHAYLYKTRPPVEIVCEVNEESKSQAYIFDHHNNFEKHPETGTFDTVYTVKYDIQECSPPVHVTCKPFQMTDMNISYSHVLLATDRSDCSQGKPGLIAFVVILVIVLILLSIVGFWKKDNVRNLLQKRSSSKGGKSVTVIKEANSSELVKFLPDGTEDLSTPETKQPLLCKYVCEVVHRNKSFPGEDFEKLINRYTTNNKNVKPFDSFSDHLKSTRHEKETLYAVVYYLVTLTPSQCVPHVELCMLLGHLVLQHMMSGDKFLVVINALRAKKLLLLEKYIEMTGHLLNSSDIDQNIVITNLKHLLSIKLVTKEELIETLLHYLSFYKMETNAILREVTELQTSSYKIPYPYFLQGIFKWQDKEQNYALMSLYNDIVKEHITNKEERLLIQIDKEKHEGQESDTDKNTTPPYLHDISYSYVQALFCSTAEGAIDCEECWNMIVDELEKQTIPVSDVCDVYKKCIENDWMKQKELLDIWNRMFSTKLINETQVVDILHLLLNKNQITHALFLKTLCEARKRQQISSEMFKNEIASEIVKNKLDQGDWIKFVVDKCNENLISKDEKSHFMVAIVETYKIERDTIKSELEKLGMSVDQRRAFLRPIPLKDLERRQSSTQKKTQSPLDKNLQTSETGKA